MGFRSKRLLEHTESVDGEQAAFLTGMTTCKMSPSGAQRLTALSTLKSDETAGRRKSFRNVDFAARRRLALRLTDRFPLHGVTGRVERPRARFVPETKQGVCAFRHVRIVPYGMCANAKAKSTRWSSSDRAIACTLSKWAEQAKCRLREPKKGTIRASFEPKPNTLQVNATGKGSPRACETRQRESRVC